MDSLEMDFARIVREHKGTIYTVCYMFSKDEEEVADLFQDILINLWKGFANFRGDSSPRTCQTKNSTVMENNTLISHELEEMRAQLGTLKEKLEKQTIINETHIRNSMKSKMSDINRTMTGTIFAGIFALVYCTWYFSYQGCSLAFIIATAVMLAVCLALTLAQKVTLGRIDFSRGNLVETAEKLSKIKKHYQDWYKIAIPMIIIWLGWTIYEMSGIIGLDTPMALLSGDRH